MARRTAPTFETRLQQALAGENIDALLAVLDSRRKTYAGAPPVADVRLAQQLIVAHFSEHPPLPFRWVQTLVGRQESAARQLACGLLPDLWHQHPRPAEILLQRLAGDERWEVREWAGGALGRVLLEHFDPFYDRCRAWTQHPSANVRRAVCIAALTASGARHPQWADPLLDLLEPLLPDRTAYVRKNLGPFAIGNGLLRRYPKETLARLTEWAQRDDEGTRWNVAMAFSAAAGADRWQEGLPILAELAGDDRRTVWRAVASALRVMARRHPQDIVPRLRAWLDHPQRSRPAAVALGYSVGSEA